MNKDEFEDKAKERVLLVEEANSTLKKLFSEATTLGLNVQLVKSKAGEVIRHVEAELNKQKAPKEVKDQIILSLKKSVVDWYNYTTYYLERRAKVAKNPIERNLYINTVAALSGKGGAKTITMGNNEQVSNLREYVMSSEKGYGNLIIPDYDKKIKNDINQLMTDISEKRLTLFDSLGRRKSIRNLAEISARTEAMRSHLLEQKEKGVKYVLSSQHADCSERCRWWQNKVFIIDCDIKNYLMQTYDPHNPPTPKPIGKVDGIDYYSLDEAINYGFLGYNCRHNLIPYQKGMYIPKSIPQNRVEKERNLEIVQRRLECKVRDAKLHEITAVSKEERQKAIADSKAYQTKYDEFCKKNGLVKYEWRCRITKEERDGLPIIEEKSAYTLEERYRDHFEINKEVLKEKIKNGTIRVEEISDPKYFDENCEIRAEYHQKIMKLENELNSSNMPLKEKSEYAFNSRNKLRIEARESMNDLKAKTYLRVVEPRDVPFDEFIDDKMEEHKLTKKETYEYVIKSATRSNDAFDKLFRK